MRLRRTGVIGVVLAIVMVTVAAVGLRLSEIGVGNDQNRAYEVIRGQLGRPVAIDGGTVEVTKVRVGTAYLESGDPKPSPGMMVVVTVSTSNAGKVKLQLANLALLTADRSYDGFPTTSGPTVDPGFVQTDDLAFEVDPSQIDDLTLQLYHSEVVTGYVARAQIHLGITPGNADAWRAAAKNQTVEIARTSRRAL